MTATQARFRDLDAQIRRQQSVIDAHAKQSAERMSKIEQLFQQFTELNQKIDHVSAQVFRVTTSNQEMAHALRSDIEVQTKQLQDQNLATSLR